MSKLSDEYNDPFNGKNIELAGTSFSLKDGQLCAKIYDRRSSTPDTPLYVTEQTCVEMIESEGAWSMIWSNHDWLTKELDQWKMSLALIQARKLEYGITPDTPLTTHPKIEMPDPDAPAKPLPENVPSY